MSAEDDRYEVVIGLTPDCFGGNACRVGTVLVLPGEEGLTNVSGELVTLADGRRRQYFAPTCGATCSDGIFSWQQDFFDFSFGLKAAELDAASDFALSARIIN